MRRAVRERIANYTISFTTQRTFPLGTLVTRSSSGEPNRYGVCRCFATEDIMAHSRKRLIARLFDTIFDLYADEQDFPPHSAAYPPHDLSAQEAGLTEHQHEALSQQEQRRERRAPRSNEKE